MVNEQNLIPKTETVQELKDEYKVPSFEEFIKSYKNDEKINNSYESEIKSYGDIGVMKGYGPVWIDMVEARNSNRKQREEEERTNDEWNWCNESGCSSQRMKSEDFCKYHKEENDRRDRWISWGIKTTASVGISAALGSKGSVVVGGAGWLGGKLGEVASTSKGAKEFWNSVSGFGGDIAKGELAGELWGIGGSEIAKEIGVSAIRGFKAGELSYSVYSTSEEAVVHQSHLDRGESYKSNCKVCNPLA